MTSMGCDVKHKLIVDNTLGLRGGEHTARKRGKHAVEEKAADERLDGTGY